MTRLPMYFNITFSELFIISGVVVTLLNCVTSVWNVLQHGNRKAFLFLLPYVNFSLLLYTWYRVSPHVVVMASTPFCLFITFGFGRMVGYIIVAHFLKSTFPMTDITWVPIALAILNGKMESWFSMPRILNPTQEYYYTWACAFFSFFMYSIFAFRVIKESCAILNISCFTIKQTKRQKLS
ncbi:hypothetical protein HMI55_006768 [Coelomomyces lativittatus]|nr:hypothetical protein HMI56_007396 [Coelomomyces lativittatus]KAJ1517535.1 hypothetical protein HMI55_006768 [Coelomomyces lativittatus]